MPHELQLTATDYGDGTQILFTCVICNAQIAFARPGDGEPHATEEGDPSSWQAPADYEKWMTPCIS